MVKIENLNLTYPNGKKALKDINLVIKKGECVLLTGSSGSGKSSIISSINGIATNFNNCSYTGTILVNGMDIKDKSLWKISEIVSSVFQNPKTHFFNVNTTLELLFYLENIGLTKDDMDKRLEEMLQIFPIENLLNRDIFKLSGGEKQILSIASSFISGNEILVLDEPSSNLDYKGTKIVGKMLGILKSKGITMIIAEHRLYYLMDVVDKVFVIDSGEIKEEYSKKEFGKLSRLELNSRGLRNNKKDEIEIPVMKNFGIYNINLLVDKYSDKTVKIDGIGFDYGKIYGVVGNNGIGKSTLIRDLIGYRKALKEDISYENKKLNRTQRLSISNLVMQDVNNQLFADSVMEEVVLCNSISDKKRIEEVLKRLNLWDVRDEHPMSLSGGQKQRVVIAQVLLSKDKMIFFDEPTSGMDYKNMVAISNLIKQVCKENKIVVIVSHDVEFLNETCDYILKLENYVETSF